MRICGCITTSPSGRRQRCVRELSHRGFHWKSIEMIDCKCKYFCHVDEHRVD